MDFATYRVHASSPDEASAKAWERHPHAKAIGILPLHGLVGDMVWMEVA